jgi:hypothetical protein
VYLSSHIDHADVGITTTLRPALKQGSINDIYTGGGTNKTRSSCRRRTLTSTSARPRMSLILTIARKEWTECVRDGQFRWTAAAAVLLLTVSAGSGFVSWKQNRDIRLRRSAIAANG